MPQPQAIRFGIAAKISTAMRWIPAMPIAVSRYGNPLSTTDEAAETADAAPFPAIQTA